MKKVIKLENLDCAHCAEKMENAIAKLDGVANVNVNFIMQKMTIETNDDNWNTIATEIKKICKKVEPDCVLKGII